MHVCRFPIHTESNAQKHRIYYLDEVNYSKLIQSAPEHQLTLVLLLDTYQQNRSKQIAQCFWIVVEQILTKNAHMKVCFLCYRAHPEWLRDVLSQCEGMNTLERATCIEKTLTGQFVTILAIYGSKKILSIFTEIVDSLQEDEAMTNSNARSVRQSIWPLILV